jgi:hypothetical protein
MAAGVTKISCSVLSENRRVPLATISTDYVAEKAAVASVPEHKEKVHDHFEALREPTLFVSQIYELIADNEAGPSGKVSPLRGLKQYVPKFLPDLRVRCIVINVGQYAVVVLCAEILAEGGNKIGKRIGWHLTKSSLAGSHTITARFRFEGSGGIRKSRRRWDSRGGTDIVLDVCATLVMGWPP